MYYLVIYSLVLLSLLTLNIFLCRFLCFMFSSLCLNKLVGILNLWLMSFVFNFAVRSKHFVHAVGGSAVYPVLYIVIILISSLVTNKRMNECLTILNLIFSFNKTQLTSSVAGGTGVPAYQRVRGRGRALPKRSTKPSFKLQDGQNDQADGLLK